MSVTAPSLPTIVPASALVMPKMAAAPLSVALQNLNHLYMHFRPALVDVCPSCEASGRGLVLYIPVLPSADGLRYEFQHRIRPTATGTVTVKVEGTPGTDLATATWTTHYGAIATSSMTGGSVHTHTHTAVLPATDRMLRITYGSTLFTCRFDHILARPDPSSMPGTVQPSGFIPFDSDALATGRAVNTELVNRCYRNALALIRDRKQVVASFAQGDDSGTFDDAYRVARGGWESFGICEAHIPGQAGFKVDVRTIGRGYAGGGGIGSIHNIRVVLAQSPPVLHTDGGLLISSVIDVKGTGAATPQTKMRVAVDVRAPNTSGSSATLLLGMAAFWNG